MFTGKTKNLGVIGNPIQHSLSPVLQNAALAKAGLDYAYIALPVEQEKLAMAVEGLRSLGFRGFNVTIPHKTAILPFLDEVDEDARIIGAVNTVVNENGHLAGYNTDVKGFMQALHRRGFSIEGKKAVILGAGGAARAVLWGLIQGGAAKICIGVRNPAKAEALAECFRQYVEIDLLDWNEECFQQGLAQAALIVNTTPLGMHPKEDAAAPVKWDFVNSQALVYDIIYTPARTKFLQQAKVHGHMILNGEEMLAGQGAEAFRLWTGKEADLEVMLEALRKTLRSVD